MKVPKTKKNKTWCSYCLTFDKESFGKLSSRSIIRRRCERCKNARVPAKSGKVWNLIEVVFRSRNRMKLKWKEDWFLIYSIAEKFSFYLFLYSFSRLYFLPANSFRLTFHKSLSSLSYLPFVLSTAHPSFFVDVLSFTLLYPSRVSSSLLCFPSLLSSSYPSSSAAY